MTFKLIIINFLTLIRIIGTIILVPFYKTYGGLYTSILALICYLTDSIDGILARKWHASTFFGSLFDGVADKLFTIMNFILLYLITPYAIIPIVIEILIVIVQFMKYFNNYNVKSNLVGKFKVWILAICVILTYLVSDINNVSFISINIKEFINAISLNKLYFILLLPAIFMEFITLLSYIEEIIKPNKIEVNNISKEEVKNEESKWQNIKNIWFNPTYYEEHKNDNNLKKITKISKKIK